MGHRANFVVIRDQQATAFYDQWAGLGCIYTFAEGPTKAVACLKATKETDELMDWAFAEGGYLIDFDNKLAMGFGSPFDEFDLDELGEANDNAMTAFQAFNSAYERGPLAFLEHIAPAWPGWKLVWDERSVDAFATYLESLGLTNISCQPASHPESIEAAVVFQA